MLETHRSIRILTDSDSKVSSKDPSPPDKGPKRVDCSSLLSCIKRAFDSPDVGSEALRSLVVLRVRVGSSRRLKGPVLIGLKPEPDVVLYSLHVLPAPSPLSDPDRTSRVKLAKPRD